MPLQRVFVECFTTVFIEMTAEYPGHDIAGVGAFTDADASSIVFMAHTRADEDGKIEQAPEYACDAVWNMAEWDLSYPGGSSAEATANRAIEALDVRDIIAHRELVWNSAVGAMAELFEQGFFDRWPDAVRVFGVADGICESLEFDWNSRWNRAERLPQLREFLGLDE